MHCRPASGTARYVPLAVSLAVGCGGHANSGSTPAPADASAGTTFDASTSRVDAGTVADAGVSQAGIDASTSLVDAPALEPTSDAAAQCGPANCNGCCSGTMCLAGTGATACGEKGLQCADCAAAGATCTSDAGTGATCVNPAPCACTNGCCDANGNCQPGSSDTQCGNQTTCADCTVYGLQCNNLTCGTPFDGGACNGLTCPTGCCDFTTGVCQQGLTNMVCGNFGAFCQNCVDKGEICSSQQCMPTDGGIACAFNCKGCCDTNGSCSLSGSDTECGRGGLPCVDCTKVGNVCMDGLCFGADGGQPCSEICDNGCCDPNGNCRPGFLDTQCGGRGDACQDCTSLNPPSTCDVNANSADRPVCAGQTCGTPYGGCPAALAETAPTPQNVCSTDELENAAVFCASGPNTAGCNEFQFSDQVTFGGQCTKCLQPFFQDFVTQVGILACVAPYVDATCNHNSACIADCVTESCFGCDESCDTQVQTGTCATYFQADQCVTEALGGPGAVCNPVTYQGNFGAWLQAVGTKYCGK